MGRRNLMLLSLIPFAFLVSCQSELSFQYQTPSIAYTHTVDATQEWIDNKKATSIAWETRIAVAVATNQAPTKTIDSLHTTTTQFPIPECDSLRPPVSISPDGKWVVSYCTDVTYVMLQGGSKIWVLPYDTMYGIEFNSGVGVVAPEFWSEDGKYLYLAIGRGVSGPICFANGWGILQLNLLTGEIKEFLKPYQYQYYSFAFSPDGNYLAYIIQKSKPLPINILEISNGEVRSVSLDKQYNQAGCLAWSHDLKQVAFCQAIAGFVDKEEFSLALLDIESMGIKVLAPNNDQFRCPTQWLDADKIQLMDYEGNEWIYDFRSGTFLD